jgi:endogenous inhibitor of DNA gyrase (YacG/DUF329 family)
MSEQPAPPFRAPRVVPCPACREPTLFTPGNPFRPFCCARCQGQDFGAWATESYRVGADSPPDTADD